MFDLVKPEIFISSETGKSLKSDSTNFGKELSKQVPEGIDAEEMESTNKT